MRTQAAGVTIIALILTLAAAVVAQPANQGPGRMGPGMMGGPYQWGPMGPWMMSNMRRHHQAMMYGIPQAYQDARNPLRLTPQTLERGAAVFAENCAACHGPSGQGNGPAGQDLSPPPANLAWLARMPMSRSDPYMNWTISEGGEPFGSDMPAFKGKLSSDELWSVIAYIRNGLTTQPPR